MPQAPNLADSPADDSSLQGHWERHFDDKQQLYYYFNTLTGQAVWQCPRSSVAKIRVIFLDEQNVLKNYYASKSSSKAVAASNSSSSGGNNSLVKRSIQHLSGVPQQQNEMLKSQLAATAPTQSTTVPALSVNMQGIDQKLVEFDYDEHQTVYEILYHTVLKFYPDITDEEFKDYALLLLTPPGEKFAKWVLDTNKTVGDLRVNSQSLFYCAKKQGLLNVNVAVNNKQQASNVKQQMIDRTLTCQELAMYVDWCIMLMFLLIFTNGKTLPFCIILKYL